MICLMLSHVRRSVAGSCASAFQKLLIQSVWRVAMISSYTAPTSGLASAYSIMKRLYAARQQLEFEPGQLWKTSVEGYQPQARNSGERGKIGVCPQLGCRPFPQAR